MSLHIGMVGLGRMGANMGRRLASGGVAVTGFDPAPDARAAFAAIDSCNAADNLEALVHALPSPRIVWLMVPAGKGTEAVIAELAPRLHSEDIIVDGGNAFYKDSVRRAVELASYGIRFIDCGVSGGIWGLENGYALMFGGSPAAAREIEPLVKILAPAPDRGWLHCGPSGSGHFVKMIHNGIEYGMMQAFAEGFSLLKGKPDFQLDVAAIAEMWRHGSVVRSWLLDLTAEFLQDDAELDAVAPVVSDSGEGRWTARRGDRAGCSGASAVARADDAAVEPGQGRLWRQAAGDDAQGLRRPQDHVQRLTARQAPMMVIVMGVSGCGKTTVGRPLARELGCEFLDADDFHPEANVAKMAKGIALTDDDRWPWLDAIVAAMHERAAHGAGAVIACSALKEAYRERLRRGR